MEIVQQTAAVATSIFIINCSIVLSRVPRRIENKEETLYLYPGLLPSPTVAIWRKWNAPRSRTARAFELDQGPGSPDDPNPLAGWQCAAGR